MNCQSPSKKHLSNKPDSTHPTLSQQHLELPSSSFPPQAYHSPKPQTHPPPTATKQTTPTTPPPRHPPNPPTTQHNYITTLDIAPMSNSSETRLARKIRMGTTAILVSIPLSLAASYVDSLFPQLFTRPRVSQRSTNLKPH